MSLRPGLLLDRDGVLLEDIHDYVRREEDAILIPAARVLLAEARALDVPVALITNQGGIARGFYTAETVDAIHARIADYAGPWAQTWVCPHHDTVGRCFCRKPRSLWFERAQARLRLDPARTVMVGDQVTDLTPAYRLGMETAFIGSRPPAFARFTGRTLAELTPQLVAFMRRMAAHT